MAKPDEISSTEKLLSLIRGGTAGPAKGKAVRPRRAKPAAARPKRPSLSLFTVSRPIVLGIEIGQRWLRVARVAALPEKRYELQDVRRIRIDDEPSGKRDDRPRRLGKLLGEMLKGDGPAAIWVALPSANVETRYLKLPKVPFRQLGNAVVWSFKKDVSLPEADTIFDFQVLNRIMEDGQEKLEIMACAAPTREVEQIRQLISRSGHVLKGVSIVPFGLQNLFRSGWIDSGPARHTCTLFLGSDWSRISIYTDGNLMLSRDIKAGVRSMVEAVQAQQAAARASSDGTLVMVPPDGIDPEPLPLIMEDHPALQDWNAGIPDEFWQMVDASPDGRSSPKTTRLDGQKMFYMILPAIDRVIRQIEMTAQHFFVNFGNQRIERLYVSGMLSSFEPMRDYMHRQLDIPVDFMDPFDSAMPLSPGLDAPADPNERTDFIPALGMALSLPSRTPNFVHTYKEKEGEQRVAKMHRSIWTVFLLLICLSMVLFFRQERVLEEEQFRLEMIREELESYSPRVNQELIAQAVSRIRGRDRKRGDYARRYQGMSVIGEVVRITPGSVRLMNLDTHLGPAPGAAGDAKSQSPFMELEGLVFGERLQLEAALANYIVALQGSPIFKQGTIENETFEYFEEKTVLRFKARLEID